jgi:hypothetical protein
MFVETELKHDIESLRKNELHRDRQVNGLTQSQHDMCRQAISCFVNILRVNFEDNIAIKQIVSIYTHMCYVSQSNLHPPPYARPQHSCTVIYRRKIHYLLSLLYISVSAFVGINS